MTNQNSTRCPKCNSAKTEIVSDNPIKRSFKEKIIEGKVSSPKLEYLIFYLYHFLCLDCGEVFHYIDKDSLKDYLEDIDFVK